MKKYEVMYIVNASVEEEKRAELMASLNAIITNGNGTIDNVNEWGLRDFAYPIEHMTKGYYVVTTLTCDNDTIKEYDRLININKDVVRYMIVKQDEE